MYIYLANVIYVYIYIYMNIDVQIYEYIDIYTDTRM